MKYVQAYNRAVLYNRAPAEDLLSIVQGTNAHAFNSYLPDFVHGVLADRLGDSNDPREMIVRGDLSLREEGDSDRGSRFWDNYFKKVNSIPQYYKPEYDRDEDIPEGSVQIRTAYNSQGKPHAHEVLCTIGSAHFLYPLTEQELRDFIRKWNAGK